ncbi:MAG: WbuC family cupin fold metalloprotein [Bacteroidota bacterium]|nr:WbuC family cupin fold metalloprotein [Bacteroidota bacterium]
MIEINNEFLDEVSGKAKSAARKRMNFNFHKDMADPLHRMINALEPGTYVQPHKHENPDKIESFVVLRGRVLVITFTDDGQIINHSILDPEIGKYGVEIAPRIFHTIISLMEGSAVYEVKNGPYTPVDDKNFAEWAPKEGSSEAQNYMNSILNKLNVKNA